MEIKIMLDFGHSPIWKYDDGFVTDEYFPIVDDDVLLNQIADKINDLYSSYYEFNSHDVACWINKEQKEKDKPIMRELVIKLVNRLNEINDGSFTVNNILAKWLDIE